MTTRWRWSPRWNTSPAACPTLSASSGVISPLARPRIPSVPKYLRLIYPPAATEDSQHTDEKSRPPATPRRVDAYNAFGAKMASNNMMNDYQRRPAPIHQGLVIMRLLRSVPNTAAVLILAAGIIDRSRGGR